MFFVRNKHIAIFYLRFITDFKNAIAFIKSDWISNVGNLNSIVIVLNHSKSMQYILCLNRKNANHEMEIKFGGFHGWEMTLRHSPGWLGSLEVVVGATTVNLGSI